MPTPQPVSSSDDTIQPPTAPPVLKGEPILFLAIWIGPIISIWPFSEYY